MNTDHKEMVLDHLKEKYEERGADFYFKSKKVSRELEISKYVVGRIAMEVSKEEDPKIFVIKNHGHGSSLFKTGFSSCIG